MLQKNDLKNFFRTIFIVTISKKPSHGINPQGTGGNTHFVDFFAHSFGNFCFVNYRFWKSINIDIFSQPESTDMSLVTVLEITKEADKRPYKVKIFSL